MTKNKRPPTDTTAIELDVIENDSAKLFRYYASAWRILPEPATNFGPHYVNTTSLNADFHVFGCEFTTAAVKYFFDGTLVYTVDATQFEHADVNIWLSCVAGTGGLTNVDDSLLPAVLEFDYARFYEPGPVAAINILSPPGGVVALVDTNTTLRVRANATSSDTNYAPTILWSQVSGPGTVSFAEPTNTDTTARFSADGIYLLQCAAAVGTSIHSAQVSVAVNAPFSMSWFSKSWRQGSNGYSHVGTFIRGDNVNVNSGARDQFILGRWGGYPLRPILSFDLLSLDTNDVIQTVTLDLWTMGGVGSVGTLELHSLNATPVEGTGDGSSPTNGAGTGATWLSRTGGTNTSDLWTTPGGDYDAAVLSSVPGFDATLANVQKTFASSTGFVAVAQAALRSNAPLNLILISPGTEAGTTNAISRLVSDDNVTTAQRPQLALTFMGRFAPNASVGVVPATTNALTIALNASLSNATGCVWSKLSGPGSAIFADPTQPQTTVVLGEPGSYVLRFFASNAFGEVSSDIPVSIGPHPPQIVALPILGGQFQLQVNGVIGVNYMIEASTDLRTWTNVFTTNTVTMPFTWTDSESDLLTQRFYRVRLGP
jgi:hypothetical protein